MGHIVNPVSFRLGMNRTWNSAWSSFNLTNFGYLVQRDLFLYNLLKIFFNKINLTKFGFMYSHSKILSLSKSDFSVVNFIYLQKLNFNVKKNNNSLKNKTFNKHLKFRSLLDIQYQFIILFFNVWRSFQHFYLYRKLLKVKRVKLNNLAKFNNVLLTKKRLAYNVAASNSRVRFLISAQKLNKNNKNKLILKRKLIVSHKSKFLLNKLTPHKQKFLSIISKQAINRNNFYILLKNSNLNKINNTFYNKLEFILFLKNNINLLYLLKVFNNYLKKFILYYLFLIVYFKPLFYFLKIFNIIFNQWLVFVDSRFTNCKFSYMFLRDHAVTPNVISYYITKKLKRGHVLAKILKPIFKNLKENSDILGYKISCSGRFSRKQRATYLWQSAGAFPLNQINSYIDYSYKHVPLKFGVCGVKVWLCRQLY